MVGPLTCVASAARREFRLPKSLSGQTQLILILVAVTSLLHAQPSSSLKVGQVTALQQLSLHARSSSPDSALMLATRALHMARELNNSVLVIDATYSLGAHHAWLENDSLAIALLQQGLEKAKDEKNDSLILKGNLELARLYVRSNAPRKAIVHLNDCVPIVAGAGQQRAAVDVYTSLGEAYRSLGIYNNSTDYYLQALRFTESLNDDARSADIYSDIGMVYMRTGDFPDALEYFQRAQDIYELKHDSVGVVIAMMNTGVIYQKQGKLQEALDIYFRLLPRTRQLKTVEREAIVTGNIGSTLVTLGKVEEGLTYLKQALALKEAVGEHKRALHTLNDIANAKIQLGDARGAKEAAEKVVHTAVRYEGWDQLRYGYLNLSTSYKLLADYENAYHFLEKYNALNDSLFGIQKAEQINELQIQYDTEKKDMAIHSLEQEKQIAHAQRNNYILGGTVLLLLLVGLYINQRMKTRRNLQLLEKEREVDRLKSDFFANISHEFRTPLSLILGPIDTMLGKTEDDRQRFQLELMKKSASRLLRLINQILDLSKLQFAKPKLKATEVNGVDLIRGVTATFQSMADSRGITLEWEVDEEEIAIYADQEQIETVCINLLSNAFKFTDTAGKIRVRILRAEKSTHHPEGALELQVSDNGIGIPQEHLRHIFDRFYRAGSASEKQYGGTGIGLALTKELVELHHGTIDVESALDKGTSVTVRLPLGRSHLREDQIATEPVRPPQPLMPGDLIDQRALNGEAEVMHDMSAEKALILLMDDNEDVRSYIKSILADQYILFEAPNGAEGLRMARAFIPDLIVSDVMMPVMDGYEACKRLKKDEKTSHIPVILLTARASVNSRLEGLETEADLYLSKPFVPQELLLCIHNLIQSRRKLRERYNRQVVLKPVDISINSTDEQFLQRLMKILEANYGDEAFSVEQLSVEIGMSRSQLHRKLQALTNESASQFIRTFRLQRAMELLKKSHASISEIAYMVGFSNAPYFNRCFLQHYGCTPSAVIDRSAKVPAA